MRQINRYLIRHFLRILALTLAACIGLYLLVDFFEKVDNFIEVGARPADYLAYFLSSLPVIFVQVAPLSVLMSMVLTLGGLGRTSEITAMRAGGISLWQVVRPILFGVVGLTVFYLLVNELIAPLATRTHNRIVEYQLKGRPEPTLNSGHIWYRDGRRIINVVLALPRQQRLQGISLFELDENFQLTSRLQITELRFVAPHWHAAAARQFRFSPDTRELIDTQELTELTLDLGRTPADFSQADSRGGMDNAYTLWRDANKLQAEGFDTTSLRVDLHARLAAPFACIIMGFLGIPFAVRHQRGSSPALGIALSLLVGVAYFLLMSMALAFGYAGALPPLVAGWTANLIFLLIGLYLLLRMRE